jgi:hypothetical protein
VNQAANSLALSGGNLIVQARGFQTAHQCGGQMLEIYSPMRVGLRPRQRDILTQGR